MITYDIFSHNFLLAVLVLFNSIENIKNGDISCVFYFFVIWSLWACSLLDAWNFIFSLGCFFA